MTTLSAEAERRNRRMAVGAAALALAMGALTFAAAPFYSAFCRATGYAGTPQRVEANGAAGARGERILRVAFDANVAPGLPFKFAPETDAIEVRPGKTFTVFFRAENLSDREIAANATFNVSPDVSGAWFDKVQCFCFAEQKLKARETVEWPVVFFLDPKLEQDETMARIDAITLSYTLFAVPAARAAGERRPAG